MQIVIRKYEGEGAKELFKLLEERSDEIKGIIESVSGLISYTLAHTEEGGITVTICEDQEGIEKSIELARNWIMENAADLGVSAPEVSVGNAVIHVAA